MHPPPPHPSLSATVWTAEGKHSLLCQHLNIGILYGATQPVADSRACPFMERQPLLQTNHPTFQMIPLTSVTVRHSAQQTFDLCGCYLPSAEEASRPWLPSLELQNVRGVNETVGLKFLWPYRDGGGEAHVSVLWGCHFHTSEYIV